jgi:hypothetical protein
MPSGTAIIPMKFSMFRAHSLDRSIARASSRSCSSARVALVCKWSVRQRLRMLAVVRLAEFRNVGVATRGRSAGVADAN